MTRLRQFAAAVLAALAMNVWSGSATGEDPARVDSTAAPNVSSTPLNFPTATLGGVQFWTDELVFRGWRIQQNALTGHYRLLDERDFRMAWGTFEQCQARLEELKREHNLPPLKGRAVVTLHGLGRSRDAMHMHGEHIAKCLDATWINVSYASSRRSLDEHAQSLRVLSQLEGIDEIHFVCHSLGNLVVRRYLGEASLSEPRWKTDPRIKRMVMLGPPNNGAQFARLFKDNKLFGLVTGPSGKQLALPPEEVAKRLATPTFEFGIIAGSSGEVGQSNPVVAGDDDLIVAVEETRLAGASDFLVVPSWHGTMLRDERVCESAARFLKEGYFVAADKRRADSTALTSGQGELPMDIPAQTNDCPTNTPTNGQGFADTFPRTGRIAGIDFGTVRIGVAVTDPEQRFASPHENYTRRDEAADAMWIMQLAAHERLVGFVVGLPVHTDGNESRKSSEARAFGEWLSQQTNLPVRYFDERYTSAQAEALLQDAGFTSKQRKERLDKLAAQLMLTAYLESSREGEGAAAL